MYPKTINNLIECFKKFPGIGEKTAERLALSCLTMDDETIELFTNSLQGSKKNIKYCEKCGNLSEEDLCVICKDTTRDNNILCVVEESKNIILFEKIGTFNGKYHVLGGLISPLDGINPEDINISSLIKTYIIFFKHSLKKFVILRIACSCTMSFSTKIFCYNW